ERGSHAARALAAELLVVGRISRVVGMAFDAERADLLVPLHVARHVVEDRVARVEELGRIRLEADLAVHVDAALLVLGTATLRAAVTVAAAFVLGGVGALVVGVADAVAVVVALRAAVLVLVVVLVLGPLGAAVVTVEDAVSVTIRE